MHTFPLRTVLSDFRNARKNDLYMLQICKFVLIRKEGKATTICEIIVALVLTGGRADISSL